MKVVERRSDAESTGGWEGNGWAAADFDDPGGEYDEIIDEWCRKLGVDSEWAW